jgi:hypothetical protein
LSPGRPGPSPPISHSEPTGPSRRGHAPAGRWSARSARR